MTLTDPRSDRALVQTNASSVVDIARRLREDLRAIDELRRGTVVLLVVLVGMLGLLAEKMPVFANFASLTIGYSPLADVKPYNEA